MLIQTRTLTLHGSRELFRHGVIIYLMLALLRMACLHYFELASSGNLQVEGDYLAPPLNGGVISVNESDIISQGVENALISAINSQMTSGFITRSGIINPAHFDMWTPNGYGIQKNNVPNISIDHVMIMWRNHTIPNGTGNASPNQLGIGTILGYSTDTWSQFGAQTNMPLDISRHEFAHLIVGGNNFHVFREEQSLTCGSVRIVPMPYLVCLVQH